MANALHLAVPSGSTTPQVSVMEVLPADASALVICEVRWGWRVVGTAVQRLPAAQGMVSAAV